MATARIRTHFPEEVTDLCEALIQAGYTVETIRPDEFRIAPADLELVVDKLPAVEAWRRIPDAETVFVAPGTPCSGTVRGTAPAKTERAPLFANWNVKAKVSEHATTFSGWMSRQGRELRAWMHDLEPKLRDVQQKFRAFGPKAAELRRKLTPPHEYLGNFRPKPAATVNPPQPPLQQKEIRLDHAFEQAQLRQEELRRQQQAEQQFLIEQARLAEDSRRRAREAAEARALLEEQQRMEALERASQKVSEPVIEAKLPAPRTVERQRPRLLPRTRRERAFFRAGMAAIVVSLGLGMLAAQALHPKPAAGGVPKAAAQNPVPFAKPVSAPITAASAVEAPETKSGVVTAPDPSPAFTATTPVATASLKKPSAARRAMPESDDDTIAEDQVVIVRKPAVARAQKPKARTTTIAHYSDLD